MQHVQSICESTLRLDCLCLQTFVLTMCLSPQVGQAVGVPGSHTLYSAGLPRTEYEPTECCSTKGCGPTSSSPTGCGPTSSCPTGGRPTCRSTAGCRTKNSANTKTTRTESNYSANLWRE